MWPFSVLKNYEKDKLDLEEWCNKWPIGKQFTYLGIELIITRNFDFFPGENLIPMITADYLDKNGVILSKHFSKKEMERIVE